MQPDHNKKTAQDLKPTDSHVDQLARPHNSKESVDVLEDGQENLGLCCWGRCIFRVEAGMDNSIHVLRQETQLTQEGTDTI